MVAAPADPRRKGASRRRTLRFLALTRRARAEVRLSATQRTLVDDFIQRAIRSNERPIRRRRDALRAAAPERAEGAGARSRTTSCCVLDEDGRALSVGAAARIPSARGRASRSRSSTACCASSSHRCSARRCAGRSANTALVIGDPLLPEGGAFAQLPGAREEAEAGARNELRSGAASRPSRCIQPSARGGDARCCTRNRTASCTSPATACTGSRDRRVTREASDEAVSGHGDRRRPIPDAGGGAADAPGTGAGVHQLLPPRLHRGAAAAQPQAERRLRASSTTSRPTSRPSSSAWACGRSSPPAGRSTTPRRRPSRARFYGLMLTGATFGDAVTGARERTWAHHPYANTWGAYQCYGDPGWKLLRDGGDAVSGPETEGFASPAQAANELRNLAAWLKTGAPIRSGGSRSCSGWWHA